MPTTLIRCTAPGELGLVQPCGVPLALTGPAEEGTGRALERSPVRGGEEVRDRRPYDRVVVQDHVCITSTRPRRRDGEERRGAAGRNRHGRGPRNATVARFGVELANAFLSAIAATMRDTVQANRLERRPARSCWNRRRRPAPASDDLRRRLRRRPTHFAAVVDCPAGGCPWWRTTPGKVPDVAVANLAAECRVLGDACHDDVDVGVAARLGLEPPRVGPAPRGLLRVRVAGRGRA